MDHKQAEEEAKGAEANQDELQRAKKTISDTSTVLESGAEVTK